MSVEMKKLMGVYLWFVYKMPGRCSGVGGDRLGGVRLPITRLL